MKNDIDKNPIKWLAYVSVFWLVICILQILDANVSGVGKIWGLTCYNRGTLNPIVPFSVVFIVMFLLLYVKRSQYAWHVLFTFFVLDTPVYRIFRFQGVNFRLTQSVLQNILILVVWIGLLAYMIYVYKAYRNYVFLKPEEKHDEVYMDRSIIKSKLKKAVKFFIATVVLITFAVLLARSHFRTVAEKPAFVIFFAVIFAASITGIKAVWHFLSAFLSYGINIKKHSDCQ